MTTFANACHAGICQSSSIIRASKEPENLISFNYNDLHVCSAANSHSLERFFGQDVKESDIRTSGLM